MVNETLSLISYMPLNAEASEVLFSAFQMLMETKSVGGFSVCFNNFFHHISTVLAERTVLSMGHCSDLLGMQVVVLQTAELGDSVFRGTVDLVMTATWYKLLYLQCSFFAKNYLKTCKRERERETWKNPISLFIETFG